MRCAVKRMLAALLAIILIVPFVPVSYADTGNNEDILQAIWHVDETDKSNIKQSEKYILSAGERDNITLQAPFSYPDMVNLNTAGTSYLQYTYDTTLYSTVSVVCSPSALKTNDSDTATITVYYYAKGESTEYKTVYTIKAKKSVELKAAFSGQINKSCTYPVSVITFSQSDFTSRFTRNDSDALTAISIDGLASGLGDFYTGSSKYTLGNKIDLSSVGSLTFSPLKEGEVTVRVTAYTGTGKTELTGQSVNLTLSVSQISPPTINSDMVREIGSDTTLVFSALDFRQLCNNGGGTISQVYIYFNADSKSVGTWYVGNSAMTSGQAVNLESQDVRFEPTGLGTAKFTWQVKNENPVLSNLKDGSITVTEEIVKAVDYTESDAKILNGDTFNLKESTFAFLPYNANVRYVKIVTIPAAKEAELVISRKLDKHSGGVYPAIEADKALKAGAILPIGYLQYLQLKTKTTNTNSSVSFTWAITTDGAAPLVWSAPAKYTVNLTGAGSLKYSIDINTSLNFSATDFSNEFSKKSSEALSYVTFTLPSKDAGVLYLDYNTTTKKGTALSASTKYNVSSKPYISGITFVPAKDYTGTVTINYKAFTASGKSGSGTVEISVSNTAAGTLSYTIDKNSAIQFDAYDFKQIFKGSTDRELSYMTFSIPGSSTGTLYYNYESKTSYDRSINSSSDRFYVYRSYYLSYVTFAAKDGFTGTASFSYTAYDTGGSSYSGKINIYVVDSPAGIVQYSTGVDVPVYLSSGDFADEFISITGSVLSYVTFTLPAKDKGVLYSKYTYNEEKDSYDKKAAAASTKFYVSGGDTSLSDVVYVPVEGYSGTVTVSFKAYTAANAAYDGKLKITTGDTATGLVTLSTGKNEPVDFFSSDFTRAFSRQTGKTLSYVKFSLPSASYGAIRQNYRSDSNPGTSVSSQTSFYASGSPNLSDLTFVPAEDFTGTVTINFRGFTSGGDSFDGRVRINVDTGDSLDTIYYSIDRGGCATFDGEDFNELFMNQTGSRLSYVQFKLPSKTQGVLYFDYSSSNSKSSAVTASTKYYRSSSPRISGVTFVPADGFAGSVTVSFEAYSTTGIQESGRVVITVESTQPFSDVEASYPWASAAIEYLYRNGVVNGTGGERFEPGKNVIRGDFMLMLYRAFDLSGGSGGGFSDVPSGSYYAAAISAAKAMGIAKGNSGGRFEPESEITRQDAMVFIYRTLTAKGTYLPSGEGSLGVFTDSSSVDDYAVESIGALVKAGLIVGSNGRLNPKAPITRAEMATILYRVLIM